MRAMLRSTRSMSMTAAGVPYSRAILAARGVVTGFTPLSASSSLRAKRGNPVRYGDCGLLRRYAPRNNGECGLRLFDLFTEHFELQPFVLCLLQFLLCFRKHVRGLVEFL